MQYALDAKEMFFEIYLSIENDCNEMSFRNKYFDYNHWSSYQWMSQEKYADRFLTDSFSEFISVFQTL